MSVQFTGDIWLCNGWFVALRYGSSQQGIVAPLLISGS